MSLRESQTGHDGSMSAKLRRALSVLAEAAQYASETGCDIWDFAVEVRHLFQIGLATNDLRYLLRMNLIDHASEIMVIGTDRRSFRRAGAWHFTGRSCFVLTRDGVSAANALSMNKSERGRLNASIAQPESCPGLPIYSPAPMWDTERNTLYFDGRIVKQFTWGATNQTIILSAFQEEGWPARIDDPLIPIASVHSKRRLSDTIKCLNRKQQNKLLQFRGDGTGQGVVWESATRRQVDHMAEAHIVESIITQGMKQPHSL